ncbi:hypothetical protein AOQ84DRAFT_223465 [Glonium stellatum]|uniref:Uncharacterized protein n=1 Tax=Glonium stellatum TaxID=574774 RepID=A0A8E2EXM4_9PEZI|nr:hypothetical protein AOQ84DRAFT_223465 [Glonium stellatum]
MKFQNILFTFTGLASIPCIQAAPAPEVNKPQIGFSTNDLGVSELTPQRKRANSTRTVQGANQAIGAVVFLAVLAMRCQAHILACVFKTGRI